VFLLPKKVLSVEWEICYERIYQGFSGDRGVCGSWSSSSVDGRSGSSLIMPIGLLAKTIGSSISLGLDADEGGPRSISKSR
jgi:hypothetical protein